MATAHEGCVRQIIEKNERIAELERQLLSATRQNTDLQARNTELVERNRVQGKALKNSCCPSCSYHYEVKIWIKGLDGELEI